MAIRKQSSRPRRKRPRPRTVDLGIGGRPVPIHSHISYLWANAREFAEMVGFLEAGLRGRDQGLLIGSDETIQPIFDLLAERGLDVEALMAEGRLRRLKGAPSARAMLANYAAEFDRAVARGALLIRLLGVPAWGDTSWPSDASLLSVEAALSALARRYPVVIVCGYDMRSVPPITLDRAGVRTHPMVVAAGRLIDSARSVPAPAFVASLASAVQSQSDRMRAEERLAEERARLDSITDAALSSLGLDDLLRELLARLRAALRVEFAAVRLVDEDAQALVLRAVDGVAYERLVSVRIPLESLQPITLDAPYVVNDLRPPPAGSDDWYAQVWSAVGLAFRARMGVPLRVEGRTIGVLNVASTRTPFTEEDQRLLRVVADRVAPTIERGRLTETVRASQESLEVLSRRLVEIQEVERGTIARELHDEVGQLLTGLGLMIDGAQGPDAADQRREMKRVVGELIGRVRDLSMDLRPPMLDALGLLPALLWQIERFERQTGVIVDFQHADLDRRFPPEVEMTAFRIVQEGLTNVARHAGVARAKVEVWADAQALGGRVQDDGRGFVVEEALAGPSSGLVGMRERSRLLGGRLTIESAPGSGTRLSMELPLSVAVAPGAAP